MVKSNDGGTSIRPDELQRKWNISNRISRKIIQSTTALNPRNTLDISLNRRYDNNDGMIRYTHLNVTMFNDTMFASSRIGKSVKNFTFAQCVRYRF